MREEELARRQQVAAAQHQQTRDVPQPSHATSISIEPAVEEVFDPYVVLDVPRDASQEGIRAAYQRAKAKYDPTLVSDLAYAAREHLITKTECVERAYQMLSDGS